MSGNPKKTRQAARRALIVKREMQAAELRLQELTEDEIAARLGVSLRQAKYDIQRGRNRWREKTADYYELFDQQLAWMQRKAIEQYLKTNDIKCLTEARKCQESRRILRGTNKQQSEVTINIGNSGTTITPDMEAHAMDATVPIEPETIEGEAVESAGETAEQPQESPSQDQPKPEQPQ